MDQGQKDHLKHKALHGWEIVDGAARLGVMNLYLRGIGGDETNIVVDDSLRDSPSVNFDMVLTNPPFGRKSSLTFVNTEGESERDSLTVLRDDFWATTSNKQLKLPAARAVPAEDPRTGGDRGARQCAVRGRRGGDGAAEAAGGVRCSHPAAAPHRRLLRPRGQGQRPILRPQAGQPRPRGPATCGYMTCAPTARFTLKANPLTRADLDDFVACYNPDNRRERRETERFRRFSYEDLV